MGDLGGSLEFGRGAEYEGPVNGRPPKVRNDKKRSSALNRPPRNQRSDGGVRAEGDGERMEIDQRGSSAALGG